MAADPQTRTVNIHSDTGEIVRKETVLYSGVLSKAHEEGLSEVRTALVQAPTEENARTAIVKAEIRTEKGHFEGYGDASPDNVGSDFVPHLIRVAETRAKARALRDAVNVGVTSLEELTGVSLMGSSDPGSDGAPSGGNGPRANGARSGTGDHPMTEGQRRYLFRLVATQGHRGEAAQDRIKTLFGVKALAAISKAEAGRMIDRLLAESSAQ